MHRALLLLLVPVAACRKDTAPSVPPTFAIGTPANASGEQLACRRHGADEVFLALGDAGLALHLEMTPGSKVSFLGQELATPGDVVIADGLARLAEGHANDPWMTVDVKVTDAAGRSASDRVELRIDRVLGKRFETIKNGNAVRFAGETLDASANKLVYVRPDEDRPPYLVGDGRWRDIDLVAFETVTHIGGKSCGEADSIPIIASNVQSHIELWDRRSGKLVEKKTFEALGVCKGEGPPSVSNADQLRAWLAQKLGH